MNRIILNAVVIGLASFSLQANANRAIHDPSVNARQQHQQQRIHQGIQSGELTRHEAKQLRADQRDIKQLEQAYKSDGTLTQTERKDLQHELNQNSREIYQQKHDAQERNFGGTGVGNPGSSGSVQFGGTGVGNPGSSGITITPGTRDPGVNARQENQTDRIQQGVQSGELTRHEAKQLREDKRDIKQLEQAYKSDGTLTTAERKDLHQELNELSVDIHQQKNDSQTR